MGQKDRHRDRQHSIRSGSPFPGILLQDYPVQRARVLVYSAASANLEDNYGTAAVDNESYVGQRWSARHSLGLCEELCKKHVDHDSNGIHGDVQYVVYDAFQPSSP